MKTILARTNAKNNRRTEFNDVLNRLTAFYEQDKKTLIYHLYTKYNASVIEIADLLGLSRERINDKYPKKTL